MRSGHTLPPAGGGLCCDSLPSLGRNVGIGISQETQGLGSACTSSFTSD